MESAEKNVLTHASLFSGIGGFDLAAHAMGWANVLHCEINPFCRKLLTYYWPEATSYHDITQTDFTIHRGEIDILTGGFPCQPFSLAGKRKGTADSRHLWPQMLRAIKEIQPRWVVGENVRGIVNWSGGLVFEQVQADLETEGYEIFPFLLPACAVNAPHRRDRIWFVAYRYGNGCKRRNSEHEKYTSEGGEYELNDFEQIDPENPNGCGCLHGELKKGQSQKREFGNTCTGNNERICSKTGVISDNNCKRPPRKKHRNAKPEIYTDNDTRNDWQNFPTQSPVCGGNDGLPTELDGITLSKWRNETIKAYGNAVVPQVVLQIFKAIAQYEKL